MSTLRSKQDLNIFGMRNTAEANEILAKQQATQTQTAIIMLVYCCRRSSSGEVA